MNLTANPGTFLAEWIHPVDGTVIPDKEIMGGDKRAFKSPLSGTLFSISGGYSDEHYWL